MTGAYEGDLIRSLGQVTLNFGYAEYELDSFIERLSSVGLAPESWAQRPIGQKLLLLTESVRALDISVQTQLDALLDEARRLLNQRNSLVHGCLLSEGRVVSGRSGVEEKRTSVEDLDRLAQAAFSWKERLWSYRWKQVEPLLGARVANATPNTPL